MKKTKLHFLLLFLLPLITVANPVIKYSYDEIASSIFWNVLYNEGGWTLYCGHQFNQPNLSMEGKTLTIEHIYPTSRMIKSLRCTSRIQCNNNNKLFSEMEADLHNLYPVLLELSNDFYDSDFGEIEGEDWRFENCDFERKDGTLEPRTLARGNIARSIFYMHTRYKLPVSKTTLETLKRWNHDDPPSRQEQIRNSKIELIQGNRNPYIDKPALADQLKAK